jgi:hypothetical protein
MRTTVALIGTVLLSSCASPHLYPVCFYDTSPPTGHKAEQLYRSLTDALNKSLGTDREANVAVSPDGRWLVASTTMSENAAAAQVWPRIGCIGTATDSDQTKAEASCVRYVSEFVASGNYFAFGNAKDAGGIDIWNESLNPKDVVHCNAILPH